MENTPSFACVVCSEPLIEVKSTPSLASGSCSSTSPSPCHSQLKQSQAPEAVHRNKNNNFKNGESSSTTSLSLVLPCLHIICRSCLRTVRSQNFNLLSDHVNGIFSCPECGFLAQSCSLSHSDFKTVPDVLLVNKEQEEIEKRDDFHSIKSDANGMKGESSFDKMFCTSCDLLVLVQDIEICHRDHEVIPLNQMLKGKREYLSTLLNKINDKITHSENLKKQIQYAKNHLKKSKKDIVNEINERSQSLIEMIRRRRDALLQELNTVCDEKLQSFDAQTKNQTANVKLFNDAYNFANQVIERGSDCDMLAFHNDISNRLIHFIHRVKDASLDLLNLRVDVPERGKEESHLEKLFGSLIQGNISCGDAQLLQKFNVGLKWPTSLITTRNRDIVIAGKEGTFDSEGKLLIYDRHGNKLACHEFEEKCIPYDVVESDNGVMYVSDNRGRLSQFSSDGRVHTSVDQMFKGPSGRLALTHHGCMLVSSAEEQCIWVCDSTGTKLRRLPETGAISSLSQPHSLTTNFNNDIIISELQGHQVSIYSADGDLKFTYSGGGGTESLRCPSSVCCDPFSNILITDFTNDSVHLVSQSGQFLGLLLSKENNISCPNFITLDHEGRLFIGQYGGDVSIYRYLSYVKHA